MDGQDAHGIAGFIEKARLDFIRNVASSRDLVDELPHRTADLLIVGEGDGPDVLHVPQCAHAVRMRRIDRLDRRRGQKMIDELGDSEMARGVTQRGDGSFESGPVFGVEAGPLAGLCRAKARHPHWV